MSRFAEYLIAKRTIEDRALNRPVWDRFVDELAACADPDRPVRIVEIGAGTGSMLARLAEWDALPARISYRGVDLDSETIAVARDRLPEWLRAAGYTVDSESDRLIARRERVDGPNQQIDITLEVADAFEITDAADAVIASAVLDLVDLEPAVDRLSKLFDGGDEAGDGETVDDGPAVYDGDDSGGGLLYAPMTFNGHTSFIPTHPLDGRIERLYHRHMDEIRDQPGSSRAGQQLLDVLPTAGYRVLEAGGSDWVIRPTEGAYPGTESTVLAHLLSTIDSALPDYPAEVLSPSTRAAWVDARQEQLARGELTLVAHHLDVLARLPAAETESDR